MQVRQVGKLCVALLSAVVVQFGAAAPAAATWGMPSCGAVPMAATAAARSQASGRIPGLGHITGTIAWDGQQRFTLSGGRVDVTRTFTPLTREIEIALSAAGEQRLVVRFGGADGLVVTRGSNVVRGTADPEALRALVGGPAVAAFRERIGNYERQLIAGYRPASNDDAHADAFLLVGAFLGSLAGDPTSLGRARDLVLRRVRGKVQAVRFEFKDCVRDYEQYLLMIDQQRTECLDAAEGRDTWYVRAADRLGCEVEFMAGALAGEGQFASCTALGAIVS